jgi:uncharacterized protein (TIGR00369 family)
MASRQRGADLGADARDDPLRAAMPFAATLGVETLNATCDAVHARLAFDEALTTTGSVLHGGVLMALADACGGMCAFLNLPAGASGTSTIESKTNFLRAVRSGWVEATSTPLHVGRTVIVVVTDLVDDDARLVGRVTQTQAVLRP